MFPTVTLKQRFLLYFYILGVPVLKIKKSALAGSHSLLIIESSFAQVFLFSAVNYKCKLSLCVNEALLPQNNSCCGQHVAPLG